MNYIVEESETDVPCNHIKDPQSGVLYACFPLFAKNEIIGLLHIRCGSHSSYETEKRTLFKETAETLTALLSLAVSNLRLNEKLSMLSIKDALTGLFNRRYLEETFIRESVRAKRNKSSIGIIMADIDHFKKFNDIHGHAAGDAVLKQISHFLSTNIRGCDIVCRYGGEEFVLILPDANLENTFMRANTLVESIRKVQMDFNGTVLGPITMSMGVSAYPEKGEKLEELLRVADAALYRAKQEGRDRVVSS
jgi:diguanylate cyclase (GGDEF)-like protein